jgi:hypothetical protein
MHRLHITIATGITHTGATVDVAIFSLYLVGMSSVSEAKFTVTTDSMKTGVKSPIGFHYLHDPYTEFWCENQEERDH